MPSAVDIAPLGFLIQAFIFIIAIFYCRIFDINEINKNIFTKFKEGVIIIDGNGRVLHFNQASKNIFNWIDNSLIGKKIVNIPEAKIINDNPKEDFNFSINQNNEEIYFEVKVSYIDYNNPSSGLIYIINENTQEILLKKNLEYLANYDGLTKVYNQVYTLGKIKKRFELAKENQTKFSVIMIDLNNFKIINDKFGHLMGNDVLVLVAQKIYEIFSPFNYVFGRFGGDEFIISGTPSNKTETTELCQKLIDATLSIKKNELKEYTPTLSIGISYHDFKHDKNQFNDYEELIKSADFSMYKAKNSQENIIIK
ncbi:MAG: diguanylate cyclase [Acholeplasmataceae bacterium]